VCEKNADTIHDFSNDPLKLYVDGDLIKAQGTTLGADNGIAIAFYMALLESNEYPHPPLEILLTVEEETGLQGAFKFDDSLLKGRRMINIDSTDDTILTTGCAAGMTIECAIPFKREKVPSMYTHIISVKGLKGGHSGADIHLERGNAIRILAYLLHALGSKIRILDIASGMKVNAIPREATATIISSFEDYEIYNQLDDVIKGFAEQYRTSDPHLKISVASISESNNESYLSCIPTDITCNILETILLAPNGVTAMSTEIPDLVNASCNIGVVKVVKTSEHFKDRWEKPSTNLGEESFLLEFMPRANTNFYMEQFSNQFELLMQMSKNIYSRRYQRSPAWHYNPNSQLLKIAKTTYQNMFGTAPTITAVHAGLECGLFADKLQGLDVISYGVNLNEIHTPNESMSIASVQKVWKFLLEILKAC